jgi:hypothetical protein
MMPIKGAARSARVQIFFIWAGGLLFCAAVWAAVFNLLGYAFLWLRYG